MPETPERPFQFRGPVGRILGLTLGFRVLYSALAAVIGIFAIPNPALIRSNAFTDGLLAPSAGVQYYALGVWQRFDTLWYLHIAEAGYDVPAAVVFYPLYPILIALLRPVVSSGVAAAGVSGS